MSLPLIHLAEVDSTQDFLSRHPEIGECGVLADAQRAGRGRSGNAWESAAGAGLWLSARLAVPAVPPGLALQKAMAAVIAALEPCELALGLKWPNDLVAWQDDHLVKLGGIIGEISRNFLVMGVGVNVTDAPRIPGRAIAPAALITLNPRTMPDRLVLAEAILSRWLDLARAPEPIFLWPAPGDAIRWEEGQGVCQGWAGDGRLQVQTEKGLELLSAGDVSGLTA